MEWCKLGVIFAIICMPEAGSMARLAGAFTVSLAGTFIFMAVVNKVKSRNIVIVPLIGIMLGGVVGAASTFFAYKYDIIQNTASWLQGNFSLVIAGKYELLYLGIPIMAIAFLYADRFTKRAAMAIEADYSTGVSWSDVGDSEIGCPIDFYEIDEQWVNSRKHYSPEAEGDPVEVATRIVAAYLN